MASLLHRAVEIGSIRWAEKLINSGEYKVNCRDSNGRTPLHIACDMGYFELVRVLVWHGANLTAKDLNGNTPLTINSEKIIALMHFAYKDMEDGFYDLVHVLQDCRAHLNVRDDNGKTPFMIAARNKEYELVKSLVCDYGIDPNITSSSGKTPLHVACADGDIDLIHVLVRDCKANLNISDDNNDTPLMIAARNRRYKVVKLLICDYGCDPNVKGHSGKSLLHIACANDVDFVHVLLKDYKADLNAKDDNNNTPLMTAVENNKCAVVKLLISEYKCDISKTDSKGRSLLHKAGGIEVLKLLIEEYKMSPLLTDDEGNTPLHLFSSDATNKYSNCAQAMMFDYHAPIFIHNKEGKTPRDVVRDDRQIIRSLYADYLNVYGKKIQADYKSMQSLAAKRYSGSNFICRLFVVGHPGAGKSSLVETLKRIGFFESFIRVSEKLVPPHTAGIVPSIFISDSYGRVQFYDFAGDPEYYSSHAAILERLFQSNIGTNICILVLNLLEDDVLIEEKYLFWLSFINYSFKRLEESPSVLVIGSHSDQLPNQKEVSRKQSYVQNLMSKYKRESVYLSLDCCRPRSRNIRLLQQNIHKLAKKSQPYSLSLEESILLGLLEKDFSNVTACTAQIIASHIKELNLSLPRSVSLLYPILQQLQAIGLLLLVGGKEQDCYVILNIAQLTNEVHKKLFSKDTFSVKQRLTSFNIGLIPESLLQDILPKYITKECLLQLQYCQEVSHVDIGSDHSISPSASGSEIVPTSLDKSYIFFPALCSLNKKEILWQNLTGHNYSIGWLARCTNPNDFFPPRFLHILLLRIALRFTLVAYSSDPEVSSGSSHFKRNCKMWKSGMHWLTEKGVECEVDVKEGKEVVVLIQSIENSKSCLAIFNSIIACVIETKAEFCHSIKLELFLLNELHPISDDNLYPLENVEKVLQSGDLTVVSIGGTSWMDKSKLVHIYSTFWESIFPINEHSVLKYIENIMREWLELGLKLELPLHSLKAIETNHPRDVIRCKIEMVSLWLSSLLSHPPCWWSLVKALQDMRQAVCAANITEDQGEHIVLQEKLLNSQDNHLIPGEEFLEPFAEAVGSKWPYLASLLSLTSSTIEEVRREGEGLTQRERALLMLHKWVSKEEATYSQLYQKLKPVSLFQYCK